MNSPLKVGIVLNYKNAEKKKDELIDPSRHKRFILEIQNKTQEINAKWNNPQQRNRGNFIGHDICHR
jgi:hypothetical protein